MKRKRRTKKRRSYGSYTVSTSPASYGRRRKKSGGRAGMSIGSLPTIALATIAMKFLEGGIVSLTKGAGIELPKSKILVPGLIYWLASKGKIPIQGLSTVAAVELVNTIVDSSASLKEMFSFNGYSQPVGAMRTPAQTLQMIESNLSRMHSPSPIDAYSGLTIENGYSQPM